MTYRVYQSDIDGGLPSDPFVCPVARSIKRRHRVAEVNVSSRYVLIGAVEYVLPERVRAWIRAYDSGEDVRPFRFELISASR